jgi:hypothetical protein
VPSVLNWRISAGGARWPKPQRKSPASGLAGLFLCSGGVRLHDAFALGAFAGQLAGAAHGFGALAGFFLGRLFKRLTRFHFPEQAFALHLLLESAQGLLDVIIADNDLYYRTSPSGSVSGSGPGMGVDWA